MTTQKDFKRLVRARMEKTGEAYTTARAQLLKKGEWGVGSGSSRGKAGASVTSSTAITAAQLANQVAAAPAAGAPTFPDAADFARLAGMSDEKVKKATGCAWKSWVKSLDHVEAYNGPTPPSRAT